MVSLFSAILVTDAETGVAVLKFNPEQRGRARVVLCPDGRTVAYASLDQVVRVPD